MSNQDNSGTATNLLVFSRSRFAAKFFSVTGTELKLESDAGGWSGWTNIQNFGPYFLFYNKENGILSYFSTDGKGLGGWIDQTVSKNWDILLPLINPDESGQFSRIVLAYSKTEGTGEFFSVVPDDKRTKQNVLTPLQSQGGWRKTWHSIVALRNNNGPNLLLFYEREKGDAEIYSIDGKGNFALVSALPRWNPGQDIVTSLSVQGTPYLLAYSHSGKGEVFEYAAGKLQSKFIDAGWLTDWTNITTCPFSDQVVFYRQSTGSLALYRVNVNGSLRDTSRLENFGSDWSNFSLFSVKPPVLRATPAPPKPYTQTSFFNSDLTVLVTDMSGFTRLTKARGIIHFVGLMLTMRSIGMPLFRENGAWYIGTEADNLIGVFPDALHALTAAVQLKRAAAAYNATVPAERADWKIVFGGFGLSSGKGLLLTSQGKGAPFGSVRDEAFELGENLSDGGKVLLAASTLERLKTNPSFASFGETKKIAGAFGADAYEFTASETFGPVPQVYDKDYKDFIPQAAEVFLKRHTLTNPDEIAKTDQQIKQSFSRHLSCVMWGLEFFTINQTYGPAVALEIKEKVVDILKKAAVANNGTVLGPLFFYASEKDALVATKNGRDQLVRYLKEEKDEKRRPEFKGAGIHTGDILYLEGTDIQFGDPINTASKLGEDYASEENIYVSTAVYDSVHSSFPNLEFVSKVASFDGGLSIPCYLVQENKLTSIQLKANPTKYIVKGPWVNDVICWGFQRAYAQLETIPEETNGVSGGVVIEGSNSQLHWVYGVNHFAWVGNYVYLFVGNNLEEGKVQTAILNEKFPPGTMLTYYPNLQTSYKLHVKDGVVLPASNPFN
jgi:class 3 adenylate cyclase